MDNLLLNKKYLIVLYYNVEIGGKINDLEKIIGKYAVSLYCETNNIYFFLTKHLGVGYRSSIFFLVGL